MTSGTEKIQALPTLYARSIRRKLLLTALFLAVSAVYFAWIFGSLDAIIFCCDAVHYLERGAPASADHPYLGYRSYLNYLLSESIRELGSLISTETVADIPRATTSAGYAAGAFVIFLGSGIATIWLFSDRPQFVVIFSAVYLNPFVFACLPYPLQEGQVILLALPLIAWLLLLPPERPVLTSLIAGTLAGGVWMLKPAYALLVPIILGWAVYVIWRSHVGSRRHMLAAMALIACFTTLVLPQSAKMLQHFGTINPYPSTGILQKQLVWGWGSWRYETIYLPAQKSFQGLHSKTPFREHSQRAIEKRISAEPSTVLAVFFGHLLAAFNSDSLKFYVVGFHPSSFSSTNFAVGIMLFLGCAQIMMTWCTGRRIGNKDVLLDGIIGASMAFLPFVAVESRFAALPLALIFIRAGQVFVSSWTRRETVLLLVGALLFSVTFTILSVLMFQTTGLPWPK